MPEHFREGRQLHDQIILTKLRSDLTQYKSPVYRTVKIIQIFLTIIVLTSLFSGCKKEDKPDDYQDIPVVAVNFAINPNGTEFINLNTVNGSEYLTGGYQGIIVFRSSINEFTAFERSCPYDWYKTTTKIVVDTSGITARCPSCNSKFILIDGTPYAGPSRYPLVQYHTSYDGNLLYIYN
jgi:nitrite reductase/ring-hydroxylating ferredoxin subunit